MKDANYKSPEFYKIIKTVNTILKQNDLEPITDNMGKITDSLYNVGRFGNIKMWRITNYKAPQLMTARIMLTIKKELNKAFPKYMQDKTIRLGCPEFTKNSNGEAMASIVIMLTELPDNVITQQDLSEFNAGNEEAISKCFEIESRMFRRTGDKRDSTTRVKDFAAALIYEPKLLTASLSKVSELELCHQDEVVTLEADFKTDFKGKVAGKLCNIEGKSTKQSLSYSDPITFAEYIKNRLESNSLGSLHGAEYCLFIIKPTKQVICFEVANLKNNWLAGYLD